MIPIPPPPDYEPTSAPPPPPPPGPALGAVHPRPGELTIGWRWVLTLGWISIVVGLFAVSDAARVLHKPPFWVGEGVLIVLPFILPAATAVLAFNNHRFAVWAGCASVFALGLLGVIDRRDTPGIAAALGVLALIGAMITGSSFAGRMPAPHPSSSASRSRDGF